MACQILGNTACSNHRADMIKLIEFKLILFDVIINLTLSLPDTRIWVNFSTVYNDTLVVKGVNEYLFE